MGDLDSEDLSCRRICKEARIVVISVEYEDLSQNLSTTIVMPHIGIATIFGKD